MANNNRRRVHSSPSVYFSEAELTYSAKSLGITTLGIAGETLRGPAFQVIPIEDWRAYQTYFGGTSTEKYKGTQYPKYELPYIAKSYLEQSRQLEVVRVLGLSGVNAGPAWVITAYKNPDAESCVTDSSDSSNDEATKYVVAVLRSRGAHMKSKFKASADPENGVCEDQYEFDGIEYFADEVSMVPSQTLALGDSCNPGYSAETGCFNISTSDYGTFTLVVKKNGEEVNRFSVSLNPGAKNYIVSVLGTVAETGDAEIYVEEMYDVALKQLIEAGEVNVLSGKIDKYPLVYFVPSHKPVDDLLTMDYTNLTRRNIGQRYLYQETEWMDNNDNNPAGEIIYNPETGKIDKNPEEGHIYTVSFITIDNRRKCVYIEATVKGDGDNPVAEVVVNGEPDENNEYTDCVKCKGDGLLYISKGGSIVPVTLDFNNYKEQYRYSSTPWVLSELKGSAENVELNRLFRFHTISDGNTSSTEIKVSIANIDPENGTFDVYIRDFYDTDNAPVIYERYSKCTLVPGDKNYVALKIGSFDGTYSAVSKYVTVEVNENDNTRMSVPAGFLGYPVRDFKGGAGVDVNSSNCQVYMKFNQDVDEDIKPNRQYFGVSDRVGIDEDMFRYKGVTAYYGIPSSLTPCFHLDARILNGDPNPETGAICEYNADNNCDVEQVVTVDGVKGYSWVTVGRGNVTEMGIEPRIGTEDEMYGTIYEDKAYRKFTMAFYGGWDGWDYYRTSRSNTDEFAYGKYKGNINYNSGYGTMFNVIQNPEEYELESTPKSLNSDYYAYLSAIRQLSNPKNVEINVLATPGIDYVNNLMLVEDVMEMVNDRADVLYVVTTPDKPSGAGDSVSEMYTAQDAVWNLEDSEIDTNRACTYYPWGKYFDSDNSQYVFLPITRDVVKSIAYTDNIAFPWYGNAGWDRGSVSCVAPRKKLKVGEQDTLYDGRINFVNSFAKEGDRIWGDKNLQVEDTQMNRISKRRLMLRIKKLCENACINMIFNPLDNATEQTFRSAVKPILEKIKADRGIVDFRIEVDNSTEARERHELPAIIYVKPTPLLEYIDIKAVVTAQGVSWS